MPLFLQQADDDAAPKRFSEDTPIGEKSTETSEDRFTREHDALINSDAVLQEKASRESLRKYVEKEHSVFSARTRAYEQREDERRAREAQKAQERAAREADAESPKDNVVSFAAGKKRAQEKKAASDIAQSRAQVAKRNRAVYLLERVRSEVNLHYRDLESALNEDKKKIKEIDAELRKLSASARDERHEFGQQTRETKREMEDKTQAELTRAVNKLREGLYKSAAQLRRNRSNLMAERAALQAGLNKKAADLNRFKELQRDVQRVYNNRNSTLTDPFKELDRILSELKSRFHINLPNLRLAA